MSVKTLERCFNKRIDWERSHIVGTVADRIQNAVLTAIDSIVAPKVELASKSINASSGQDATSVTANSVRGELVEINASLENASGNNVLHVSNVNDDTRTFIPDEVSELSVPETRFDRQTYTLHKLIENFDNKKTTQMQTKLSVYELSLIGTAPELTMRNASLDIFKPRQAKYCGGLNPTLWN